MPRRPHESRRTSATRQFRHSVIEPLEERVLLTAGTIELGPSDNIALDQPRVAIELALDTNPDPEVEQWESVGPSIFNTFLLDTGANSVLAMATAVADMLQPPLPYETEGLFVEVGVGGPHPMDISASYRFDFAGTTGIRHTLLDTRILSDPDNDFSMFGPWGIVGMPGMANRVTTMDMRGWSGGGLGLDDLYMKSIFSDDLPPEDTHRYALPVDNRVSFDPMDYLVSGEPPVWADIPFMTAIPQYQGVGEPGSFLFDTGAQISFISRHLALQIGLDSNGDGLLDQRDAAYVGTETIGGVGGTISVPVFAIDEVRVPVTKVSTGEEVELIWTDLQWLVLDIDLGEGKPPLDGVFGSDLLTSGWFYSFFYPDMPDGYIDQVHLDFREWDLYTGSMGPRSGTVYLDLNPAVDEIILPGPGIRIRETARSTEVIKGVSTDTYSIALQTVPSAPVQITLTAESPVLLSADGGTTFDSTLVVTLHDTIPATITVVAEDDGLVMGSQTVLISHAASSADADYHAMPVREVEVLVHDNRDLVTFTSDAAGANVITSIDAAEGGDDVHYWIRLSESVATETWIHVEDLDGQVVVVNPNNIWEGFENVWIFGAGNWNTPQLVVLTAVDDSIVEGPHQTQLVHTVIDLNSLEDPIVGQNLLTVYIADNDLGGVIITEIGDGTRVTEGGETDSYEIALATTPLDAVQIELTADSQVLISDDGGITFASTLVLTFHDTTPQEVTVRAVDDDVAEGTHTGRITHAITGEVVDPSYPTWLTIADVTAEITDNDSAGVAFAEDPQGQITITSIDVVEGGDEVLYWVSLTSRPKHEVTIFLGDADGQLTAVDDAHPGNTFLVFAPLEWNVSQAVRVGAVDDGVVEGPHSVSLVHSLASHDRAYQGSVLLTVNITDGVNPVAAIVGRHVFYNRSAFDGNDAAANSNDDNAIAPNKTALLPGQTATFANYTSYSRGINGIMVDIADSDGTPTADDFQFRVGNSHDPSAWPAAPAPMSITVRPGEGVDESDRVTLIWADNAIQKRWLQVTVLSDAEGGGLGLEANDVFYFGNAIGETGNDPGNAIVNASDEIATRYNASGFSQVPLTNVYDFNRDKFVNATDQIIARFHRSGFTPLILLNAPGGGGGGEGEGSGDGAGESGVQRPGTGTGATTGNKQPLGPNGIVARVAFYLDTNGNRAWDEDPDLLIDADVDGADGLTRTVSIDRFESGLHTLFAPARDDPEAWSEVVSATALVRQARNRDGTAPGADAASLLFTSPHATDNPNRVTIRTRGGGTVVADLDPETEPFWPGPDPDHLRAASRDRWRASLRAAPARESTDLESLLADIADAIAARWARWK